MSAAKHTPGPWFHDYDGDVRSQFVYVWAKNYAGPAEALARVDTQVRGRDSLLRGLADMRLIVAAPDMLEALRDAEAILRFAEHIDAGPFGIRKTTTEKALSAVRAAIAKAGGAQS